MQSVDVSVPKWLPPPGTLFVNVNDRRVRWYIGSPHVGGSFSRLIAEDILPGVPVQVACTLPVAGTYEHYIYVILPSGRLGHRAWSVFTAQLITVLA